jgi:hypothetical protein
MPVKRKSGEAIGTMRTKLALALVASATAATAAVAVTSVAAAGAGTTPHSRLHHRTIQAVKATKMTGPNDYASAATKFSNVPDSGFGSNSANSSDVNYWGIDNYTQVTTLRLIGSVPVSTSGCGSWSACYEWQASVRDSGTTTTIPNGAGKLAAGLDPGTGTAPEQVKETIKYSGGSSDIVFYASSDKAYGNLVPRSENDDYNTNPSDQTNPFPFVAPFFAPGAHVESVADITNDGYWSWTYTLPQGGDAACPHYGPVTWTDAWDVPQPVSGDIYAENSTDCPSS